MNAEHSCFKAYDVRGRVPDELSEGLARRIGRAFAQYFEPGQVVVGHDVRLSSPALSNALSEGLMEGGVEVHDIGLCGTEEVYFATFDRGVGGGIAVTASHNPMDYNGLKFVTRGARPVSSDSGLFQLRDLALAGRFQSAGIKGEYRLVKDNRQRYTEHLLSYVDRNTLKPLKIVVNAGNGGAGLVVDSLAAHLPFEFVRINHEPDGSFPNGIPNPLLPERREATAKAVRDHKADFGVAWDGDFDRCFFFDERGDFVEGYYLVGLLARVLLESEPSQPIIYDPRLIWNTIEEVSAAGGVPVQCKSGHAFIKASMRDHDALYGGEMSAHHYFRRFAYCDSGMIPWLLMASLLSKGDRSVSELLNKRIAAFPCSGEINFQVHDPQKCIARILAKYEGNASSVDRTDGIGMEFGDWRFNLRASNTEPLLRLNVETRGDANEMVRRTDELSALISASSA